MIVENMIGVTPTFELEYCKKMYLTHVVIQVILCSPENESCPVLSGIGIKLHVMIPKNVLRAEVWRTPEIFQFFISAGSLPRSFSKPVFSRSIATLLKSLQQVSITTSSFSSSPFRVCSGLYLSDFVRELLLWHISKGAWDQNESQVRTSLDSKAVFWSRVKTKEQKGLKLIRTFSCNTSRVNQMLKCHTNIIHYSLVECQGDWYNRVWKVVAKDDMWSSLEQRLTWGESIYFLNYIYSGDSCTEFNCER